MSFSVIQPFRPESGRTCPKKTAVFPPIFSPIFEKRTHQQVFAAHRFPKYQIKTRKYQINAHLFRFDEELCLGQPLHFDILKI